LVLIDLAIWVSVFVCCLCVALRFVAQAYQGEPTVLFSMLRGKVFPTFTDSLDAFF
jgi:hypothetical protein